MPYDGTYTDARKTAYIQMPERRPRRKNCFAYIHVMTSIHKSYVLIILSAIALCMTACAPNEEKLIAERMEYARLLSLKSYDGYEVAEIVNPWDTTRLLQRLILVHDSCAASISRDNLPQGTIVNIPLKKSLVATTVHTSLLNEMGCVESIAAVCDAQYVNIEALKDRLAKGLVTDCGNAMAPDIEHIIAASPDGMLLSPYENIDLQKLENLNIPIIQCADYVETSPLGRAEWIKLYGLIYGVADKADSIFRATRQRYEELKSRVEGVSQRPTVLSDIRYGQVWYVPSDSSTVGQLYKDAGAINPFAGMGERNGSIALSPEQVLQKAHDADIWLVKTDRDFTVTSLGNENEMHRQFKAYRSGQVWACNTLTTRFYEEEPFHPERLLADFIRIFHPELNLDGENVYYKKIKP